MKYTPQYNEEYKVLFMISADFQIGRAIRYYIDGYDIVNNCYSSVRKYKKSDAVEFVYQKHEDYYELVKFLRRKNMVTA